MRNQQMKDKIQMGYKGVRLPKPVSESFKLGGGFLCSIWEKKNVNFSYFWEDRGSVRSVETCMCE